MSEQRTEETVLAEQIVEHRRSGATFAAIAMLYDISIAMARYYCRRAVKRGQVSREQMRMRSIAKPKRISDDQYPTHWLARVKARCTIDENGCWLWQGSKNYKGYGQTAFRGKTRFVHRMVYMVTHGVELREEDYVCHSCDVKACCNPAHLWKGDNQANQLDASDKGVHGCGKKTHCPEGHAYDDENTAIIVKANGRTARDCKKCQRIRNRMKAGWTREQAEALPVTPPGQRPVNGSFKRGRANA